MTGLDRGTGDERWRYTDRHEDVDTDAFVDVAVTGEVVTVRARSGEDGFWLDALDARSGQRLWESEVAGRRGGDRLDDRDVAVLGDAVAAWSPGGDGSGRVAVLAAADGHERWASKAGSGNLVAAGDGWFATLSSTGEDATDLWFYEVTG